MTSATRCAAVAGTQNAARTRSAVRVTAQGWNGLSPSRFMASPRNVDASILGESTEYASLLLAGTLASAQRGPAYRRDGQGHPPDGQEVEALHAPQRLRGFALDDAHVKRSTTSSVDGGLRTNGPVAIVTARGDGHGSRCDTPRASRGCYPAMTTMNPHAAITRDESSEPSRSCGPR